MATTWTTLGPKNIAFKNARANCTSGTETAAPAVGEGLALLGVESIEVHVEAAVALTAGGKLEAWLFNVISGNWNRCPSLDLTVAALTGQSFQGPVLHGLRNTGAIAYKPNGVGQACTIDINATVVNVPLPNPLA